MNLMLDVNERTNQQNGEVRNAFHQSGNGIQNDGS
jgi:hypothetical protein